MADGKIAGSTKKGPAPSAGAIYEDKEEDVVPSVDKTVNSCAPEDENGKTNPLSSD